MANLQGHNEPVAWKCANCGNTSDCQGVGQGDNWCNSCAVCGQMKPLYAAPPAAPDHLRDVAEKVADPWREAVLDRLAVLCMDAPQDEPPASILRRIVAAEVEIALDPRVSDVAPDGMVMVPREPTEEMIQAAAGAWGESESGLHNAFAAALRGGIAAAPAAPVVPDLKHCACEFDGDTCVTQCKLHAAHVDAIHEWAERAKAAEANMLAAPVVREPQPEPVQRLMRFAGKKRSEVSNPCLTAREAIVIADWMQAHGITGASNG